MNEGGPLGGAGGVWGECVGFELLGGPGGWGRV